MNRANFLKLLALPVVALFSKRIEPRFKVRQFEGVFIAPDDKETIQTLMGHPIVESDDFPEGCQCDITLGSFENLLDPELTRISRSLDLAHRDFILDPWFK